MKTLKAVFILLFILTELFCFGQGTYSRSDYVIPSAGATVNTHCCTNPMLTGAIYVHTNGATNMSTNTYTLTYDSLPNKAEWTVYCDFHQLTAVAANVNIFGLNPLVDFPGADTFTIHYVVLWNSLTGLKQLNYNYISPTIKWGVITNPVVFNGQVTFGNTIVYTGAPSPISPTTVPDTNAIGISSTGNIITKSCFLGCGDSTWIWKLYGNAGVNPNQFLGTTDSVGLNFRVNNKPSGRIDYTLANTFLGYESGIANTSGANNTALGRLSFFSNTTGNNNVAIGYNSLDNSTSASNDVAVGAVALNGITSGSFNVGIGGAAGEVITTGASNVAIGYDAMISDVTGSNNVAIGSSVDVASSSTAQATVIGYNSTAASYGTALGANVTAGNNQTALGGRSVYLPGVASGVGYILTDTCNCKVFTPQPPPNFLTDSITLTDLQILALNTTPQVIVAAPGAGKYIMVLGISSIANFDTAYATNTNLGYYIGAQSTNLGDAVSLPQASKLIYKTNPSALTITDNTALKVYVPTGNPTGGGQANTLKIVVQCLIITE